MLPHSQFWNPILISLLVVLVAYWVTDRTLLQFFRRRLRRVESTETFPPLPSETPLDNPAKVESKRAQENIRSHFKNTKRLLIPGFLVLGLIGASIPFMTAVPAALVSVLLGACTVTAGVAAKPVVENFIAGLVMGFSKVLNIGDTVMVNGHYATVEDISMTHTTLRIWDWRRYIIPNSKMLQTEFLNYSVVDAYQWAYVEFWVSYNADLEEVKRHAIKAAKDSKFFAGYEDPTLFVMDTAKEGVCCWLAAWANNPSDAWMLKADIRAGLISVFSKLGVEPHQYHFSTRAA